MLTQMEPPHLQVQNIYSNTKRCGNKSKDVISSIIHFETKIFN